MDKRTKQGLIAVSLLVLVGTVATVATGQQYAVLGAPAEPEVVGIAVIQDNESKLRVYRAWTDGYIESVRKINGSETYTDWQPLHE